MKKLILATALLLSVLSYAQTEFNYTPEGLTPKYLVVETPNKSQSEIYQNALGWVKESFKNADAVIQSTIENNKIRFEGITPNGVCVNRIGLTDCTDVKYLVDLEFKDNKYRFEVIQMAFYVKPNQYLSSNLTGWRKVDLIDGSAYYNKKGELRNKNNSYLPNLMSNLNRLNSDLKSYIESGSSNKLNTDW
ncbi:DUF4468 domain-containing protein [Empedobacter falsenii]